MDKHVELEHLRHSAAHLLAHAISELYPNTRFTIGPTTDTGFFYDFLAQTTIREEDLPAIEERMRQIASENFPIIQSCVSKEEARRIFKDNPFKLELINDIQDAEVGLSTQGSFVDLCRGGHVASTGQIQHFKLISVSGVYWRGDKENPQLQRITGIAFLSQAELDQYLHQREEALKYDHRKLGKELDLFSLLPEGIGFPFIHPKGNLILNTLKNFMRQLLYENDYQEVATPIMLNADLWRRSGHYSYYKENMYFSHIDETEYAIRPMNCPGAFLIYNTRPRSYRELPMRISEFGYVHRHELSGVLHGLMRVRAFTIDDAHIICQLNQMEQEITNVLKLIFITLAKTGFENIKIGLATRPANAMGSVEVWEIAINALKQALEKSGHSYTIKEGDGAFYGPKIEIGIQDSIGRTWQCSTVQVDFVQPENFDLTCINSSGQKERVVVVHHAIFGSLERFFAILLEHYKGKLPLWLSPIQTRIMTITDQELPYARNLRDQLKKYLRIDIEESSDPISAKIKKAQIEQIPWMLVIGKKEVENNTITLRHRDGTQEFGLTLAEIIERAQKELT
ncbi:MAG: Threonine-tRNA ligase [candidate division TM6 bacterium GW2011_GWF2_43_17]|nr:MAG: Threonine-tRNA ligase [candidate division TM6 bacterium GW2011_GWF2_43_17]HAU30519.1 threonine--tRNA ligase [Candidatus Dependentiae bacterium]